jgi:gallate dioxygenase
MARIVGAIATSHTPTIGFAKDRNLQSDPVWQPIFAAYEPIRQWLDQCKPEALVVIYNDHITSFFFDHYSPFALGVDDLYQPADEGGGARAVDPLIGHAALARGLGTSLMANEFDLSFFRDRPLDHGCFSPLSMLATAGESWPWKIVPLQVGVLQFPIPTAQRCYRLGRALRRAIAAYPENLQVALVATGGLSHQVHGERCGFNNSAWDQEFLTRLEEDPESLTRLTHAQYAERGGMESSEIIMWLIMRGAMDQRIRRLHSSYYLPSMTAIATGIWEDVVPHEHLGDLVDEQLRGAEAIPGTYPYTLDRSAQGYRINRFLHALVDPAHRERFRADEGAAMNAANLSPAEQDLIRRRDWRGLIHYGAIFFVLEKLAAVSGVSNLHVYAAMRGQTLEAFQQTRNAAIQYGVSR